MKTSIKPLAKTLLLTLAIASAPALAHGPSHTGALATKANRIVGTWAAIGNVSGANCTPVSNGAPLTTRAYLMYHAGGTITELPRIPVSTAPLPRTFGVGTWHYDFRTDTYYVTFRFDWYANGVLQGYQTVEREIKLDATGNSLSGSAVSVRYLENGQQVYAQCGAGTDTRI